MIGGAIAGAIIGATIPIVFKKMEKDIHTQEGMIFAAGYGAVAGLVLGLLF